VELGFREVQGGDGDGDRDFARCGMRFSLVVLVSDLNKVRRGRRWREGFAESDYNIARRRTQISSLLSGLVQ